MESDQGKLMNTALEHLRRGEYVRALEVYEEGQLPIAPSVALRWAALLLQQRKSAEALRVLSSVRRPARGMPVETLRDIVTCFIFEDIIKMVSSGQRVRKSKLDKKNRLLKYLAPPTQALLGLLNISGALVAKLGSTSGNIIQNLVHSWRAQCWAHGLTQQPDFFSGSYRLEEMKGYQRAHDVYRNVFFAYLDRWTDAVEPVADLILASTKLDDAFAIYCLMREKQPDIVLEIGAFVGFSTCIMAQALRDNGKGFVYCIDPDIDYFSVKSPLSHAEKMLGVLGLNDVVRIHRGYFSYPRGTAHPDANVLGKRISEIVADVDVAYVDGDHATTAVLQDFMLLWPVLKSRASVILHDTRTWVSVRQAIVALFQDPLYREKLRYYDIQPHGIDGIGVLEVDKTLRSAEKVGIDRWTSV